MIVLEEWFSKNFSNPYASHSEKLYLAKIANISIDQVSRWLIKRRKKASKGSFSSRQQLSLKSKLKLSDFFEKKSQYPDKEEVKKLRDLLNISEKRISQWFAKKRFEKKSLNSNK